MTQFIDDIKSRLANGETFDWEGMLEAFYRRYLRPGDTAVDIGAHRGRHLRPMWESVGDSGKVIAFEPLPEMFQLLQQSFTAPNIVLINAAVSTEEGTSEFVFAQGTPEESGFRERTYNRPDLADPVTISVKTISLDAVTEQQPKISFIKIDVEGAELICLAGSTDTISNSRPVISVEYGKPAYSAYGNSLEDLYHFAMSIDYKVFDLFLNDLSDISDWRQACDSLYWDFLLVPNEKVSDVLDRCRS